MLQDFLALIYPRNCVACGNSLYKHEEEICNYCYINLPKTNYHNSIKNPVEGLFYGRTNLLLASSYYLFTKKGGIQKILHAIKYKGNKNLATLIGKWYATDLKNNPIITTAQYIIPVPLHHKKLKQRSFNQSEEFAKGLAMELTTPLNTEILIRSDYTATQTKKNKYERWENVEDKFELTNIEELKNKHIILVDDVITTGATIEACCAILQKIEGIKISVLSIAYASN